eukprot:SAG31_NODE_1027_length_10273_cov_50.715746_7_plen_121_part_00
MSDLPVTDPNMVSSSEFRSSIKQARATEVIKERAVKLLQNAEGASAVDAAVELHRKAILTAMADKMKAGVSLNDIKLDDIITTCQTALSTNYDADMLRIAWERYVLGSHREVVYYSLGSV